MEIRIEPIPILLNREQVLAVAKIAE